MVDESCINILPSRYTEERILNPNTLMNKVKLNKLSFIYRFSCFLNTSKKSLFNVSHRNPSFCISAAQVFENIVGKGEIARNEQFLLFPLHFLSFQELFTIFIKFRIVVCKLFRFARA